MKYRVKIRLNSVESILLSDGYSQINLHNECYKNLLLSLRKLGINQVFPYDSLIYKMIYWEMRMRVNIGLSRSEIESICHTIRQTCSNLLI